MSYFDWTQSEKKQIMDGLKKIPPVERVKIRNIIKDMTASEALAHLAQGDQAADTPLKAPTSPLKASEGIKQSMKADKGQNKPLKPSKGTKGQVKAKQPLKTPVKASSDRPQELERVNGEIMRDNFNIDVIRSDIQAMINTFTSIHGIEDLTKAPQRQFMALSSYIGQNYFKKFKLLRDNTPRDNGSALTFYNRDYDIPKLAACINLYFDICGLYNKAFLYDGVASFIGCSENTLRENSEKLTSVGIDLSQKREASLSAGVVDSKTTNMGLLAALNHWHNWSGASTSRTEVRETTVVYPVLVDINKNKSDLISDNSNNNT